MTHIHHWDPVHDYATGAEAATMVLATTDGDFRITASHADGRVRLQVEKRRCEVANDSGADSAEAAAPR